MSPHSPDLPKLPNALPWPGRPTGASVRALGTGRHRLRAMLALLVFGLGLTVLAAWAVPPLLDWGRFRTAIASIAATRLGRPVILGGEVTLRLLPEAVLTAGTVTLPDQGDGVSAEIGALRLQVAVLPLLAGRIVPRDLVLSAPVLRLPWPLPEKLAHPARPHVPQAFAAHVENGTLRIGEATVMGINAGVHGGPDAASMVVAPDSFGFGAEGFAAFAGRSWRFTSALGAPDADGVSAVDLSVSGQGAAGQTGGKIRGTLADGLIQGRLLAGGPDLSLLMPAAALAWHAEAPFTADGERIEAKGVSLSLGGAPADASLVLRLSPARLDGRVHAASLDLGQWARVLGSGQLAGLVRPTIPGRLSWSADSAQLLGGRLQQLHGSFVSDGTSLSLEGGAATLPGQALLEIAGRLSMTPGGVRLSGPSRLDAPALHETLGWLHGLAPALLDALPKAVLTHAGLTGTASLGADSLSVSGLAGQIDGVGVAGGFGIGFGNHPRIGAGLTVDRISLDDWLGADWPGPNATLAGIGRSFSQVDGDVHLKAVSATWHGLALTRLALDLRCGADGLAIQRAAADIAGATLQASVSVGTDGAVADGRLSARTAELSPLPALMPPSWRWLPSLWHGPGSVEASVSGSPASLGVQIQADAGDLVIEAEGLGNALIGTGSGTVTLRHPGAPRLLAVLGLRDAESWLQTGSLALRAHVSARPGRFLVEDFDLDAADLRLGGHLDADLSGTEPILHGAVTADSLALPDFATLQAMLQPGWLHGWGAALTLSATQVMLGGRSTASELSATLGLGSGNGLLEVGAKVMGGHLAGQFAFDAGAPAPLLAAQGGLTGAHLAGAAFGLPIDVDSGEADIMLDLDAQGVGPALRSSLAGDARLTLRDARLTGFDLAQAARALAMPARAGRPALLAALSRGATPGLSGSADLTISRGRAALAPARLVSSDGAVSIQGTGGLADGALDLLFGLSPAGTSAAGVGVRLQSPFATARAVPEPGPLAPPRPRKPRHH